MTGFKKNISKMGSIKWLRPAKPFFPNVNLRAIHSELKRQTMEIRQCGSPPLSPPLPAKMGRGVYLQQIWWIARMDPFAEKKKASCNILSRLSTPPTICAPCGWDLRALSAIYFLITMQQTRKGKKFVWNMKI